MAPAHGCWPRWPGRWAVVLPNLPLPAGLPDTYGQSLHQAYRGEWDYNLAWKPNHVFPVNAGWLGAILRGQRQIRRGLELPLPVLVLHCRTQHRRPAVAGGVSAHADIVLNVADIRRLAPRLGPQVTLHALPDALHDVFSVGSRRARGRLRRTIPLAGRAAVG